MVDEGEANESDRNNPIMSWLQPHLETLSKHFCGVIPVFDTLYLLSPVLKLQHVKMVQGQLPLV